MNSFIKRDWNELTVLSNKRFPNPVFALITQEFGLAHGAAILHFNNFIVFNG
jgi:hypothetical protein